MCKCEIIDSWACAKTQGLPTITCRCLCHALSSGVETGLFYACAKHETDAATPGVKECWIVRSFSTVAARDRWINNQVWLTAFPLTSDDERVKTIQRDGRKHGVWVI